MIKEFTMTRERPKVLTFDVVGTLIDFEGGMLRYLREAGGAALNALDDDAILDVYRRARANRPETRAGQAAPRYPDDLERVYAEIAPELGLPPGADRARGFRDCVANWQGFPDSTAALARLKRHFSLVAMTNARRWAFTHFAQALGDPFDDSITADEALCEKPDGRFFAFARGRLSRYGHGLHDIMHVAQSQYHDIGIAREMGYTVCWIERRQNQKGFGGTIEVGEIVKPHYHFATLAALADAADAGALHMQG
jgi:putative hydrolase of the HAD superfamily